MDEKQKFAYRLQNTIQGMGSMGEKLGIIEQTINHVTSGKIYTLEDLQNDFYNRAQLMEQIAKECYREDAIRGRVKAFSNLWAIFGDDNSFTIAEEKRCSFMYDLWDILSDFRKISLGEEGLVPWSKPSFTSTEDILSYGIPIAELLPILQEYGSYITPHGCMLIGGNTRIFLKFNPTFVDEVFTRKRKKDEPKF